MTAADGRIGVLFINFGEPAAPSPEGVRSYLERIFLQNVDLEHHVDEAAVARARHLARMRAPGLLEEYEAIGGSPLDAQAGAQARALEGELRARGADARVYPVFQFTEPFIGEGVRRARADGVETLVGLPVYPLCGTSTTGAALEAVQRALDAEGWSPRAVHAGGWHRQPAYLDLRVKHVRRFVEERRLDLTDPDTLLYFSVHGTPVKYLLSGSRYDRYVEEHCRDVARALGVERWAVGFQNHTNRKIDWTQPDNEDRLREVGETRLVVVPISFMHEQSETLAELDHELRAFAGELGKEFHRVPVPFDEPAFVTFLADLVTRLVAAGPGGGDGLTPCRCCPVAGALCDNAARELPPSPYVVSAGPPE